MAGLKSRWETFKVNTQIMHLLSESGYNPLYLVTDAKGGLDAVNGSWSLPNVNRQEAAEMIRITPNGVIDITPVPPKTRKGETAQPMTFIVRQFSSPDAERFRLENDVDVVKDKTSKEAVERSQEEIDERNFITIASCVDRFENMIGEDDAGNAIPMEFNTDNLIQFLKDYPPAMAQVTRFASDAKKFESRR